MCDIAVKDTGESRKVGLPASLSGIEDQATFDLVMNEQTIGSIELDWRFNGVYRSTSTLVYAGQTVQTTTTITPDDEGIWKEILIESALGPRRIVRDGSSVVSTFRDKTTTFETPEGCLIFDNDALPLAVQVVIRFARAAHDSKTLPLLLLAGKVVDLTIEKQETVVQTVASNDLKLTKYRYGIPGFDLNLWADERNRMYILDIPAQKVALVRTGYAELLKAPEQDPLASNPINEVEFEKDVPVPMRDGMCLATDIYRPSGVAQAPAILVRTPYRKEIHEIQGRYFARRGYAYAVQDCRGCYSSPGEWAPFVNEAADGFDTVEWLATRPYCNGKVGMIGASYLGICQWLAASERPPHLAAMIPNVSPTDPFFNIPYEYGVFTMLSLWWADVVENRAAQDISGATLRRIAEKKLNTLMRALPVVDLDRTVLGKESKYWREWIEHSSVDDYWAPACFLDRLEGFDIPVFHQSGWFDGDGIGSKLNFMKLASGGHKRQKLTLGPWGHTDTATRIYKDRDFTESAIIDLRRDYLRWFDRWLKGVDNGIENEPLVSLFVMGSNEWAQGNTYPLERTQMRKLYLTSAGNAHEETGLLTFEQPEPGCPPDRFTYNPADPTPDPRKYEESAEDEKRTRTMEERKVESEQYHRRIGERPDVLVYETEPLSEPLTFAGPVSAVLYASSSAKDTDWFVTLSEVDEDGKIFLLVQGKIRARYRSSMKTPELLTPGEVYEYTLDLWQTGISIPPGRKLRAEVASAAFPIFSRNLNTGGHNETDTEFVVAEQTVHHDAARPSHILLPVLG